ncbi:MAG: NYN domain-containing protein [bacterium]|nr:NYN domain-containing protein [bacterium]
MAIHYILDGYNILHALLHKMPYFRGNSVKNLQKSRGKLVSYIRTKKPQGSLKNRVTVVFDGNPGLDDYPLNTSPIQVIFTHTMSADDYIIRLVEKAANPKLTVVITSDKELRERALLLNANVLGVKEFFKIKDKPKRVSSESEKPILKHDELKEIEKELLLKNEG